MKKKPSPLKGRKWSPESLAKYQATRAANGWVPKQKVKLSSHPPGVADAILLLRNAERKLQVKGRMAESDLLMLLALRTLEGL